METTTPVREDNLPLPVTNDIVVIARNPQEMRAAQDQLTLWASDKLRTAELALAEEEGKRAAAKEAGIDLTAYSRSVALAKESVVFYEKLKAAISEGYCIVPNFPIGVIAVRTTEKDAPEERSESQYGYPQLPEVLPSNSPVGAGDYVSPGLSATHSIEETQDDAGKTRKMKVSTTKGYRDVSFPAALARVEILKSLGDALKLKIFDDIGMLPNTSRRNTDPMLIGRIHRKTGPTVSFLISWWVDTKAL